MDGEGLEGVGGEVGAFLGEGWWGWTCGFWIRWVGGWIGGAGGGCVECGCVFGMCGRGFARVLGVFWLVFWGGSLRCGRFLLCCAPLRACSCARADRFRGESTMAAAEEDVQPVVAHCVFKRKASLLQVLPFVERDV